VNCVLLFFLILFFASAKDKTKEHKRKRKKRRKQVEEQTQLRPEPEQPSSSSRGLTDAQIHLRILKRGRKACTCVSGLSDEIATLVLKRIRKKLCCNGSKREENGVPILILQGDQRAGLKAYLINMHLATQSQIRCCGF